MTTTTDLAALDNATHVASNRRADRLRAYNRPFAHVTHTDACGAPVLDPTTPDLGICENRA